MVADALNLRSLTDEDLAAFLRTILEARFPAAANDPAVWLAPFVVELHVAAVNERRRRLAERADDRGLDILKQWLLWRGRPELEVVLQRMKEDESLRLSFLQWDAEVVRSVLRPFTVTDQDVGTLRQLAAGLSG